MRSRTDARVERVLGGVPSSPVLLMGVLQILGTVGVILPRLLDIARILSRIASVGLVLVHVEWSLA